MKEESLNSMPSGFTVTDLSKMVRGWFVGDFDPTAVQSAEFEAAVQYYKAGDREPWHFHRIATEVTVIVSGRVLMNGTEFAAGSVVVIQPGYGTDFIALEDTVTSVVKIPSVKNDKYFSDN